jgi:hypothetical protein
MMSWDLNGMALVVATILTLGFSIVLIRDATRHQGMRGGARGKTQRTDKTDWSADESLQRPIVWKAVDPITSLSTYIIELNVPNRPERWRARFELEMGGGLYTPAAMAMLADLIQKSETTAEPVTPDILTSLQVKIREAIRAQYPRLVRTDVASEA